MIYEVSLPDGVLNFALDQTDGTYKIGLTISIAQVYKKVKSEFIDVSLNGKDHLRSREMKYRASILINGNDIWHSWNDGDTDQFKPLNFNTDIIIPEKEISAYLNSNTIKQILKCNFEISHPGFYITFDGQEYTFLVVNKKPDGLLQNSVDNENVSLIFNNLTTPVEDSMTENNWIVANQATQQFVIPVRYGESSGFIRHKYIGFGSLEYNPNHKRLIQRDTLARRLFAFENRNRYHTEDQPLYYISDTTSSKDQYNNPSTFVATNYPPQNGTYYHVNSDGLTEDWHYHYSGTSWERESVYVEYIDNPVKYKYNWRYTTGGQAGSYYLVYAYFHAAGDYGHYSRAIDDDIEEHYHNDTRVAKKGISWNGNIGVNYTNRNYSSYEWRDGAVTVLAGGEVVHYGMRENYRPYSYTTSYTHTYLKTPGYYYRGYGPHGEDDHRYNPGVYVTETKYNYHSGTTYEGVYMGSFYINYTYKTVGRSTGNLKMGVNCYIEKPDYKTFNDWYINDSGEIRYESKVLNEITNYDTLNEFKYSL